MNKTTSTIRLKEDNFKGFEIVKTGDSNNLNYSLSKISAFNEEDKMVSGRKIFPQAILASNQINIDGVKGNFDNWNDYGKWTFDNLIRTKLDFTPAQNIIQTFTKQSSIYWRTAWYWRTFSFSSFLCRK